MEPKGMNQAGSVRHIEVRRRRERLRELGVDLEYFPHYRRREPLLHTVDVVLLTLILRGRGRHIMEDDAYEESGCSLGITHYGQPHSVVTDDAGMEIMNIYLDLETYPLPILPGRLQHVLPEILPLHPGFQHRLNRIVRLKLDERGPVKGLAFAMYRELEDAEEGFEEAVQWLFLTHCCRHVLKTGLLPSVPRRHDMPHLEALRRHLDRTYDQPHTLGALAARVGLSPTYLCRVFKTYTGKSVFSYLLDLRIQASMLRLRSGSDKVLSVALECGFNDLAFFNRSFKARVGMTPREYRTHTGRIRRAAVPEVRGVG
jgi:AraC-like DNA-binding protein